MEQNRGRSRELSYGATDIPDETGGYFEEAVIRLARYKLHYSGLTKGKDVVKLVSMMRNKENTVSREAQADTRIFELQAEICQTLANPKRLQILNLLKKGELSVGEMVKAMSIAKANLSQHLSVMRQKGILVTRREGTMIYYRLARPKITEACAIMREVLMDSLADQEKLSKSIRKGDFALSSSGRKRRKVGKQVDK